jgi:hypothetical protein
MPAHPADGAHHPLVDMQVRCVDCVAANEDAHNFTQNDFSSYTSSPAAAVKLLWRRTASSMTTICSCRNAVSKKLSSPGNLPRDAPPSPEERTKWHPS